MSWAWEQKLPPGSKVILLALADAANEESRCWPKVKTIAKKCGVSGRTVQRVLRDFEASGLVSVTRRYFPGGGQTSNSYLLGYGDPSDNLTPPSQGLSRGDTGGALPPTKHCQKGDDTSMSHQEPKQNQIAEPPLQRRGTADCATSTLELPTGLSGAELSDLRSLLVDVPGTDAQLLLDELAGVLADGRTIKTTPLRWFKALLRQYKAGRFVPNSAIDIARRRQCLKERVNLQKAAQGPRASDEVVSQHMAAIRSIVGLG